MFASTGSVMTSISSGWMVICLIGSFILWLKSGAKLVDVFYGFFLIAALGIVPVIILFSAICWMFGIDGYAYYVFK